MYPPHYLFVWAGDAAGQQTDFLAVIDASPTSPHYGQLLTTLNTDQQTKLVHHTEYVMPAGGILFDESFRDQDGQPGFNFDNRKWPQGWTGSATPHGAVFSR